MQVHLGYAGQQTHRETTPENWQHEDRDLKFNHGNKYFTLWHGNVIVNLTYSLVLNEKVEVRGQRLQQG